MVNGESEVTMELEQRVKTLEYEVKILKNEVQRTLLDIQEQVLIHYYPMLRIDEPKPSDGTVQAVEQLRARNSVPAPAASAAPAAPPIASPAPAAPIAAPPAASAPSAAPAVASVEAAAPTVKKVSLEEIRQAQKELATEEVPSSTAAVNKLVEWAKKPETLSHGDGNGNGNIPFMRRAEDKPKALSYGGSNGNGNGSGNGNEDDNGHGDAQPSSARSTLKLLEWMLNTASKVNGDENDGVSVDMLEQLTKLNSLVDRAGGVEQALRLLEEAKLG
jgi:hypothetical protein